MSKNAILGLDIGSGSIKALVAESRPDGRIALLAGFTIPSKGIRRGVVVDMDAATAEINSILNSVKEISRNAVRNIYLNLGGSDIRSQVSRGIVAVSRASSEIHRDDVERVLEASQAINLPANRKIVHTINREYLVDGISVENALGMTGARLEVISFIIDAFNPNIKNLMKCVEVAGGGVNELIFNPLASSMAVLTRNQKELGVVLADIGYGTTAISIYEEGKLLHTKVLPIGAGHITNDLAIALKIPVDVAEKIKISYGYAIPSEVPTKESIDLNKISEELKGSPSRKYIAQVIEARLAELCGLINDELKSINRLAKLPGGVVIVGGGAKMPGIVELFRNELKLTAKIGLPNPAIFEPEGAGTTEFLEFPEYSGVLGLIVWGFKDKKPRQGLGGGIAGDYAQKVISYLKNFLP